MLLTIFRKHSSDQLFVASNHIIADIVGKDSGSIYEKGLIDSITEQEFDRKVMSLKAKYPDLITEVLLISSGVTEVLLISSGVSVSMHQSLV